MALGDRRLEKGTLGINRTMRKSTKNQLEKALGGDIVSDKEVQEFEDTSRAAADAALRANQKEANRNAQANAQGSVSQQAILESAQSAQKESADAAISATGNALAYKQGVTAQRTEAAMAAASGQRGEDARRRQIKMKVATDAADVAGTSLAKAL